MVQLLKSACISLCAKFNVDITAVKCLLPKETVVLHQPGSETEKFGIKDLMKVK